METWTPELLLYRPQFHYSHWPSAGHKVVYSSPYFVDVTKSSIEGALQKNEGFAEHYRLLRIYRASSYDFSTFIRTLRSLNHRVVNVNDMSTKISLDSVPPYIQEVLYLFNYGHFSLNPGVPTIKIVPHRSKTVPGFSLAFIGDSASQTIWQRYFPDFRIGSSDQVIGLCSIFYLPLNSLKTRYQMSESSISHIDGEEDSTSCNGSFKKLLSEVYRNCREYGVRYCLLTDGHNSVIIELFRVSYMDHSPYDIVLLSDNTGRSIPLTLGGLLWEASSSIWQGVNDASSVQVDDSGSDLLTSKAAAREQNGFLFDVMYYY